MCDACNEFHEHIQWSSELWWDHNTVIAGLWTYVLNIPIREIFEKDIELSGKIILSDLTHMMSMVDHLDIGVETPRIDSGWSLKKEFTELIRMNP